MNIVYSSDIWRGSKLTKKGTKLVHHSNAPDFWNATRLFASTFFSSILFCLICFRGYVQAVRGWCYHEEKKSKWKRESFSRLLQLRTERGAESCLLMFLISRRLLLGTFPFLSVTPFFHLSHLYAVFLCFVFSRHYLPTCIPTLCGFFFISGFSEEILSFHMIFAIIDASPRFLLFFLSSSNQMFNTLMCSCNVIPLSNPHGW